MSNDDLPVTDGFPCFFLFCLYLGSFGLSFLLCYTVHRDLCKQLMPHARFLQVRENWKKSGNLSGQGKIFFEKSGKMKNWCHQMSDF